LIEVFDRVAANAKLEEMERHRMLNVIDEASDKPAW